eukprot:COSAG06_NODE_58363_length_277_cov_0.707865_1_plen_35_part_01
MNSNAKSEGCELTLRAMVSSLRLRRYGSLRAVLRP